MARAFLKKYQVKYIVVGQLERNVYPALDPVADGLAKFEQYEGKYWKEVYHDGYTIYEVILIEVQIAMILAYHISKAEWNEAQQRGEYVAPSLETEGFIHCSTEKQVLHVANAFYRGRNDLVLLKLDEAKLKPELEVGAACWTSRPGHFRIRFISAHLWTDQLNGSRLCSGL